MYVDESVQTSYVAAWQRRRHRTAWASAAVLVLAAAVAAGAFQLADGRRPTAPGPAYAVTWAGAGDSDHLYLVRQCAEMGCVPEMFASANGGRTWSGRTVAGYSLDGPFEVPGPRMLMRRFDTSGTTPAAGGPDNRVLVSADAGATWNPIRIAPEPVAAAPEGFEIVCGLPEHIAFPCPLFAIDANGVARPLANQPPLAGLTLSAVPAAAGVWASGYDPVSRRPAVSVSHDRGRTWVTRVFYELYPVFQMSDGGTYQHLTPDVASADGITAYATMTEVEPTDDRNASFLTRGRERVMRTTDGGLTWQLADPQRTIPIQLNEPARGRSYVTRAGAHVLTYWWETSRGVFAYVSPDGQRYDWTRMPGLPARVQTRLYPGGVYLAWGPDGLFRSDDGAVWRAVTLPS